MKAFKTRRDNIHDLLEDGTYTKDKFIDRLNKVEMKKQQVLDTIASLLEREKDSNLNRTLSATLNALEVFEQCDTRRKTCCLNHSLIKLCIHVHLRKKILSWISPIINNKDPSAKQVVFPFWAKPQYY